MPINYMRGPFIDRVHLNKTIKANVIYSLVWNQLELMHAMQGQIVPEGKLTLFKDKGAFLTRLGYYPSKGRRIADMTVGATGSGGYFKLGLYPQNFKAGEFAHLKEVLDDNLGDVGFGYARLFASGRVSKVELTADTFSVPLDSFIPFRAKINNSLVYPASDGLGTRYLGHQGSNRRERVYDKRRQLIAKGKGCAHAMQTRLEVQLLNLKVPIADLGKLPNPFQRLEVAEVAKLEKIDGGPLWKEFLPMARVIGSAAALAQQTKSDRKAFVAYLRQCRAPWWNPAWLWERHSQALDAIAP